MSSSFTRLPTALTRLSHAPHHAAVIHKRLLSTGSKKYSGIPFDYSNKRALALKFIAFWGGSFFIPFVASWYQLQKSGGGSAKA